MPKVGRCGSCASRPATARSGCETVPVTHIFDRWLYRGGRPNPLARLLNQGWAIAHSAGLWPKRLATLEVPGRHTGRIISLPVVIADFEGDRYLVAMLGNDTSWVRNVRAADGRAMLRHGRHESVRLEEVDPAARPPILRRYLACAPGARAHIPVDRRATVEDFEPLSRQLPVFRITADRPAHQPASRVPRGADITERVSAPSGREGSNDVSGDSAGSRRRCPPR
jgi:hypothetical protein